MSKPKLGTKTLLVGSTPVKVAVCCKRMALEPQEMRWVTETEFGFDLTCYRCDTVATTVSWEAGYIRVT